MKTEMVSYCFDYCILKKYMLYCERMVIFMSIEKIALKVATHYHANLIWINNALHALGLRSDKQAEEFDNRHMMKVVKMYERRDITEK